MAPHFIPAHALPLPLFVTPTLCRPSLCRIHWLPQPLFAALSLLLCPALTRCHLQHCFVRMKQTRAFHLSGANETDQSIPPIPALTRCHLQHCFVQMKQTRAFHLSGANAQNYQHKIACFLACPALLITATSLPCTQRLRSRDSFVCMCVCVCVCVCVCMCVYTCACVYTCVNVRDATRYGARRGGGATVDNAAGARSPSSINSGGDDNEGTERLLGASSDDSIYGTDA
jgi:hypothetical protein